MKKYLIIVLLIGICCTGCSRSLEQEDSVPIETVEKRSVTVSPDLELPIQEESLDKEAFIKETENKVENQKENSTATEENSIPDVEQSSSDQIAETQINAKENISSELYLEIENNVYKPDDDNMEAVQIKIVNHSQNTVTAGKDYKIQQDRDDAWFDVPVNFAWNDIGILIDSNSEKSFIISLGSHQYTYQKGRYRISKTVHSNQTGYDLTVEFTVE